MEFIFEILDVIIAATIFSKMGEGKDSGKLLFRKLYTGTGFTITEGENSLTFSSTGNSSNFGVKSHEIAFGNDIGVTSSSFFKVCIDQNQEAFLGFGSILANNKCEFSSKIDSTSLSGMSFVVGGASNSISNSVCSVIIGGKKNEIYHTSTKYNNSIVGGYKNCLCKRSSRNTILGSEYVNVYGEFSFGVANRCSGSIYPNVGSSIISSNKALLYTKPDNSNYYNRIFSSNYSKIQNFASPSDYGYTGVGRFNQIFSSNFSSINVLPKYKIPGEPPSYGIFQQPKNYYNTIASSYGSTIINSSSYIGASCNNNLFGSTNSVISSRFSNLISSDNSKIYDGYGVIYPDGNGISNIIGGACNLLIGDHSNIISSYSSKDLSGVNSYGSQRTPRFTNIIGGAFNTICDNSEYITMLGGKNNLVNSINTSILGGRGSYFGSKSKLSPKGIGLMVGGSTNSVFDPYSTSSYGSITGGTLNCIRTCDNSSIVGGYKNVAFMNSVILGGSLNVSGFSRCKEKYGNYKADYKTYYSSPGIPYWPSESMRGTNCVDSSEILIGGTKNCMTLSNRSSIILGKQNIITNSKDSVILGGIQNKIEAHGAFGTQSENWFVLGINADGFTKQVYPATAPWINRPQNYGSLYYDYGWSKNNFIIGGCKNSFGSCIKYNYLSPTPTGGPWDLSCSLGLTTSKTHYVYNSGIVGGRNNTIYNKSRLLSESWIENENNKLRNSVIIGGKDIKLYRSNTFGTSQLIITGSASSENFWVSGTAGLSGTWTSVTKICSCNGLVVGIVGTPSDMRLKIIIKKIGQSNWNLNIYLFRYISDPERVYSGVIAQELLNTKYESAVSTDQNGFYQVDYSKIDVEFKEIIDQEKTSSNHQYIY